MSGNIIRILIENTAVHPERKAIVERGREVTYGELLADVRRAAAWLRERGLGPGSRVLIFVPMSIDLYEILLALFHIGATAVFVDAWAGRERLRHVCRAVRLDAFIGVPKAHLLRLLVPEMRAIPRAWFANVRRWRPRGTDSHDHADVSPEDSALVTFTTGSTGAPKGANRTHGFLMAQHGAIVRHLDPRPDDVDMPALPIFVLSNLAVGATSVLPAISARDVSRFDPRVVAGQIVSHGVTRAIGSPPFFERLADHLLSTGEKLPSLRRIYLGGAAIFPSLAEKLLRAFPAATTTIVYGSTEAEPIAMIEVGELLRRFRAKEGAGLPVGRPVDSLDVAIFPIDLDPATIRTADDLERHRLAAGEPGEICVHGDHVLGGYLGEVAATNRIVVGGETWLRTGDAGLIDGDGMLRLLGRVRQSFLHDGRRVFVLGAEMALREMPGIGLGTVISIGGRVRVVVERGGGAGIADGEIIERLRQLSIPVDEVVSLRKIPRDPRHRSKIDYEALRAMKN